MLRDFVLGQFLTYLPHVFFATVFLTAVYFYAGRVSERPFFKLARGKNPFKRLAWAAVIFRFIYAAALTAGQYVMWSNDKVAGIFLKTPLASDAVNPFIAKFLPFLQSGLGYFLFYSWGRFWLNAVISLLVAYLFYVFLKALRRHNDRFFDSGEPELGFLMAALVGWPGFVVFLPVVFLLVVVISLARGIVYKEAFTTLGWPFIIATAVTYAAMPVVYNFLNLGLLNVG